MVFGKRGGKFRLFHVIYPNSLAANHSMILWGFCWLVHRRFYVIQFT